MRTTAPTATSRWSSSASPKPPRSPPAAGWAAATRTRADGAAVDAMRLMIDSVSMDGVVVIGEGEKDEAPMLFNGEQVGDGRRPGDRRRGRPDRRHDAHGVGPAQRALGDRARAARHDVLPRRRACTWRRSRPGPRPPTRSTSTRRRREHPAGRQGEGQASGGGHGDDPRPPPPRRRSSREIREAGARVVPDHRRRRRGRDRRGDPAHRGRHAVRHRRHPRGRHRGRRVEVPGRRDPGRCTRGTTRSARRCSPTRASRCTGR